jgi:putative DNA primase/helicase
MNDDPFAPVRGAGARGTANTKPKWISVAPVPADAPPAPGAHPTLGKPGAIWTYADVTGAVLGYVLRFDNAGGKQFRPLTLWRPAAGDKLEWRWESWPPKRPLYGLQRLAEQPSAPVLICEGEKAADAATRLLPGFVAVTSPNGSKSAGKADWSPLKGRSVTVWPDADAAGREYARQVAKLATAAGAASVAIVSPPPDVKVGWDAADALADGRTVESTAELVAAAAPAEKIASNKAAAGARDEKSEHDTASGGRRRTPQRDVLIGLTEFVELWHDAGRTAYASFTVKDHREHWPVRSRDFKMWLSGRFYEETGGAIGGQALEDGLRILEARAVNDGPEYEPFIRVGRHGDKIYLDLCDARWRAVEITAAGWSIVENPPLKLLRSSSMRPLPEPEAGGMIEELRGFLNVRSDDDFKMLVAWLVAALWGRGPYPVLVLNGEHGTSKSWLSGKIRSLVDPNAAPIRALSKDERDLAVSAANSHVLAFDNISSVPPILSDALAGLATGRGFATRKNFTDREEEIFQGSRPIMLNGIPSLTDRADLADRALTINLAVIPEDARRPEGELNAEFETKQRAILGALLDAVSAALQNFDNVKLDRAPRMADFAKLVTAAEPGLGWEPGAFLAAYNENRRDVMRGALEADSVGMAIDQLKPACAEVFEGTPAELLTAINAIVPDTTRKSKYWPQNPAQMGNRFKRAAPLLRAAGYIIDRRHSGKNIITIVRMLKNL